MGLIDNGQDWLSDWWDNASGSINIGDTTIDFGQGVVYEQEEEQQEDDFPWLLVGGGLIAAIWYISR